MKCPTCGRFMKESGYYTNDHDDSWEATWRCSQKHDEQIGFAYSMPGPSVQESEAANAHFGKHCGDKRCELCGEDAPW